MYQKDFILRMIEMMGDFIMALLGKIRKGDFQQAEETLAGAYTNFLKEDAATFHNIPKESLTETLLQEHNYTSGHLEILAELFFAEGELLYARNKKKDGLVFYEKSLILLEFIIKESNVFSLEKQKKQELLNHRIDELKSNEHSSDGSSENQLSK